jgi:hypothetical protein
MANFFGWRLKQVTTFCSPSIRVFPFVISAPRNDIDTLKVMADSVIRALATIAAGQIVKLDYPGGDEG